MNLSYMLCDCFAFCWLKMKIEGRQWNVKTKKDWKILNEMMLKAKHVKMFLLLD